MGKRIYLNESQFKLFLKEMTNAEISQKTKEINTTPTEPQKEAGNYKMAHVTFGGFKITRAGCKTSPGSRKDYD